MRILIGTLLFISFAVFSNCNVPDALAVIFQRHRQLQPISHGIQYYSITPHEFIPIHEFDFETRKITRNGFVIGVIVGGLLRPIYDINQLPVIVRENDVGNTLLTPEEIRQIPYNSYQIYNILPGFLEYKYMRQVARIREGQGRY